MSDTEAIIARINALRARVKQTQTAATTALVHYEEAAKDLEAAQKQSLALGIKPDDLEAFLEEEASDIDAIIKKAEGELSKVEATIRG